MKPYDLAFSLGRACSCTESLREAHLQFLSFPWDWIDVSQCLIPDLQLRTDSICDGTFHDWFRIDDLELYNEPEWLSKSIYKSKSTGLNYNHDFPKGIPLRESFPDVKAKYERRFARLLDLIRRSKHILLVRIDPPSEAYHTEIEDCRAARRRFAERFPHAKFDLVLLSYDRGRAFADRLDEQPEEGLRHISFDYKDYTPGRPGYAVDLKQTAAALREIAAVRDYRTNAETKAFRVKTRKEKMRKVGAETRWQYFLARHRKGFLRLAGTLSPRILLAKMRTPRFDHVFSLGVNCEPGFRFFCRWGFVDSTPFTWAQTYEISRLLRALRHLDEVGADGFEWMPRALMWRCRRTGISFHGRMKVSFGQPPPDENAKKADSDELAARLAYLGQKLATACADTSTKAFIYRVNSKEVTDGGIGEKLDNLQSALAELGAKGCPLVVVAERKVAGKIPPAPGRVVRFVKTFNPCDKVTVETLGDMVGWTAIFTEFAPAAVKKATHRFKFE